MNYSLEEQVAQWRVDEAETLDNYAQCDWTPPEDVLGAYVTMILFKDSDVDLLQASRYAVETQSARAQMWVKEQAEWEKKYDPLCTQDLRTRFLGECLRKGVNTEWLVDAKQRWEVQAFSSISPKFLTIGDVSVEYSGMNLSLKKEVDLELPVSQPGRESLTTFRWREGGMMKGVQAARPKINGERFVSVRTDKSTLLQGFVTYKLPLHFIPDTVEYYAGKFYVIAPITEKVLEYEARDLDGRVLMLSFLPHPWNTPDQVAFLPDLYTHKYDGVMVAFQGQEYRVKFDPTIEVELDKEIWEVREYDGKLHRVRNRFGKTPVSLMSALGRMRTSVLAGELVKLFVHVSGELPEMFKASSSLNQNASAKVLFLTPDGRLVFFRDKRIARLDFGGGMLKDGESPVDAAIREISEEFVEPSGNLMLAPSDLYYLGMSREEGDTVVWTTHLFVARAPENVGRYEGVELYSVHSFRDFKHSPNGRPRQVWLAHYLQWLSENLETVAQLQIFLSMLSGVPPQAAPNKWVRTRCLDAYVERIVKIFSKKDLYSDLDVLAAMIELGAWCDTSVAVLIWARLKASRVEALSSSSTSASSTSSSTIALSTALAVRQASSFVNSFPVEIDPCRSLLDVIYGANKKALKSTEFYSRLSELGLPIGHRSVKKWTDRLVSFGLLSYSPAVDSCGRVLVRL